jgi:hypothetical protein
MVSQSGKCLRTPQERAVFQRGSTFSFFSTSRRNGGNSKSIQGFPALGYFRPEPPMSRKER